MNSLLRSAGVAAALGLCISGTALMAQDTVPVNLDNFIRAESDLYFAKFVKSGAFGKFLHAQDPAPIDKQDVIRMNRDTLYSYGIADLAAGPVTVTMPEADGRFMSLQVISEDHYTPMVIYEPGKHVFTQEEIGTRYVMFLLRTFVDPNDPVDLDTVHALQAQSTIEQGAGAAFEIPNWDVARDDELRDALNRLASANGGIDSSRMFGPKEKVDRVQHLLGTAAGWGGNPVTDAYYEGASVEHNDGKTVYKLTVKDVPVDGFWSISIYNTDGFFEPNDLDRYSLNNVTAKASADGTYEIQLGGCTAEIMNCVPVPENWNYLIRLYRPRAEILDGSWHFPVPVEVK